jgi:hypothetical protein
MEIEKAYLVEPFGFVNKIQKSGISTRRGMLAPNGSVLLQVGDLITSCPELQLGYAILLMLRTVAWRYSSAETTADSSTSLTF